MKKTALSNFTVFSKLLLFFLFTSSKSFSQDLKINVALGASSYSGDLSSKIFYIKETEPAISLGISSEIATQFRLRLQYTYAGVNASDGNSNREDLRKRNLRFFSKISELSLLGEYDFSNSEDYYIYPYIFGGFGIFHFNPKTYYNGNVVELAKIGTEGQFLPGNPKGKGDTYNLTQFNLTSGIGLRYHINEDSDLGFEFSYRKLFTDYLDDVHSSFYVKAEEFIKANQKDALALSFRGYRDESKFNYSLPRGLNNNDSYYSFQIRYNHRLNFLTTDRKYGSYKVRFF